MEQDLLVNNLRLSVAEQESLRLRIIRTAKKNLKPNGKIDVAKVSEICECSTSHVKSTWKKYQSGGVAAVKAVKMGRPQHSGAFSEEQQSKIRQMIIDKTPEQLKIKGFLWDRARVAELIYQLYKIRLCLQTISKYLKKWGMTPQRPITRNYKQQPEAIQKWLDEEYPIIKERANAEGAEIHWGDETGCQNETNYVKGYAPKGQTPILLTGNPRLRINMISTITNQGKLRFMFYETSMNAQVLLTFLRRLIKDAPRKVFLILDNLPSHHAIIVREWLERHKEQIEVFYLPSYAPEYNPDEYLNGNLKREMANSGYSATVGELESKARGFMMKVQRNPKHIASFFQAKSVRYAADC